jgi:hypothetical protein
MKGRGKPVGGIEPDTTAILIITCTEIKHPIPQARYEPNLSEAVFAMRNALVTTII